ncbi:hypothetical protein [Mitsuokella multacida]|jgi:uncharacterized GH25 family protein|uniref:hypothetical protein n=1 Tax=Mitsuokella multacida TaxID=52226 RepID=UPI0022E15EB0|nr:hypothetical protein [Mitsuokella multacida]
MKKLIAVGLLALVMAALLLGCGQAKLTSQEVKGGVTSLQMDLPFTLEQQPKEEAAKSNDYVKSITDSRVTQAKGMDFHLMQFTTYVMNTDKLKSDAASKAQFEQKALDGYLTAFEQNAKAKETSRDAKNIKISGKDASVTTVQCKMRGEDETLKVVFLPLPEEYWFIAIAYPKEHEDDQGKLADKIIGSIQLKE